MRPLNWVIVSVVMVGLWLGPHTTDAEIWRCTQPDGSVLFKDGEGHGCRPVGALPELQSTEIPSARAPSEPQSKTAEVVVAPSNQEAPALSSRPFTPASRTIPSLSYHDLSPGLRAKGWNIPNKGDIMMVHVDVSYWPAGNGPSLTTDHHVMEEARQALGVAVLAAAKAVRYDPRFIRAHLTIPVGSMLQSGLRVDGPSAGAAWAVAVTSALLGDPLRADVCLSGTINLNLVVGPVGGLEHKIEGCHLLPQFREMLLPVGQNTFAITDKGMARSIKVREVSSLAEAYEITTGQPLRSAP